MIFHFHKTKVSVNLFIVLKISLASHVTLLVIVIITCIHERRLRSQQLLFSSFFLLSVDRIRPFILTLELMFLRLALDFLDRLNYFLDLLQEDPTLLNLHLSNSPMPWQAYPRHLFL